MEEVKVEVRVPKGTHHQAQRLSNMGWSVEFDGTDISVFTTLDRVHTLYRAMRIKRIPYYNKDIKIKLM